VEEGALQSKKTGAEADLLRTSWIIVSVLQQEKISAADRKIGKNKLGFIMASFPYYGARMEGASC
jgi:hypothetical protein